jgi:hypothetical protein
MQIILSTARYTEFLKEFRLADRQSAANNGETEVVYTSGNATRRYFYRAPNFELIAYDLGGGRINLVTYNHVGTLGAAVGSTAFDASLLAGGGGNNQMTGDLSRVVALTSEAARSSLVETAIKNVLGSAGRTVNLDRFTLLFTSYKHTAKHVRYFDASGAYAPGWRPLRRDDYLRFFSDSSYTGDSTAHCALVRSLAEAPNRDDP